MNQEVGSISLTAGISYINQLVNEDNPPFSSYLQGLGVKKDFSHCLNPDSHD